MPVVRYPGCRLRDFCPWPETSCLNDFGMLSLHEVYEVVGSQLTESDISVLSSLLNEMCKSPHPSDVAEPDEEDESEERAVAPNPWLVAARKRLKPQPGQGLFEDRRPSSGLELLLELEKRGYLSDGNLKPLLTLLRIVTRHDLLHLVSEKKRRPISPERAGNPDGKWQQSLAQQLKTSLSGKRRKKKRGHGWSHRPRRSLTHDQPEPENHPQYKMFHNIRLTVRVDYTDHEAMLRGTVSSDKQDPLERQFDLFESATNVLRSRDLGCIICNIKFTDRDSLDAFWRDYLAGDLLEALKAVFITSSMRMAAGGEDVRLLISVNEDDYEEGRRLLKPAEGGKGADPDICMRTSLFLA